MQFSWALVTLLLLPTQLSSSTPQTCFETAKTQSELNECAENGMKAAKQELYAVYQQILRNKKDEKEFLVKLTKAQQAWLIFRDAELDAIFPKTDKPTEYGTVYHMCYLQWKSRLTLERTTQLRKWLNGVAEGDVCSGSLPFKKKN